MASDITSNIESVPSSSAGTYSISGNIECRTTQNLSFSFTSPNVADTVPCIDTSIFTSLPAESLNELLQEYEDPVVSESKTLLQTSQKEHFSILPLVESNVPAASSDLSATDVTPSESHCACIDTSKRDEAPFEQVFIRDGQMYRLLEAGVISLGNIEMNAIFKNNQWYISSAALFHIAGPEVKKIYDDTIVSFTNLDILTTNENEFTFLAQQTSLPCDVFKELISVGSLQIISRYIIENVVDVPIIKNIAYGEVYKKVLGNNVKCSNCGKTIKKDSTEDKYELVVTQTASHSVVGIPLTVGMVIASNAKFCAFQMNDKTHINLTELVRFKMFTWTSVQKKLATLKVKPVEAPAGVEERFDTGSSVLCKGQWVDLVTLRCICCMGNGKCTVKGHSEEVWQALKMGECTYQAGLSLVAMDETQNAVVSIPVGDSEEKKSPTSTLTLVNSQALESSVNDTDISSLTVNTMPKPNGSNSNGSEEHVSSTTDGFVLGTPQVSLNDDQLEQRNELVPIVENCGDVDAHNVSFPDGSDFVNSGPDKNVIQFQIAEPSGEVVEVNITEIEENAQVDVDEVNRQFGFSEPQNNRKQREVVESVQNDRDVEMGKVTKTAENGQQELLDYFIGRPRGRPGKNMDVLKPKPSVETATKRGKIFLFPGEYIVPDVEELNRLIEAEKVIIGQKNLSKALINKSSIAECLKLKKESAAQISFSGEQVRNSSKSPASKQIETTQLHTERDAKPMTDDLDKVDNCKQAGSDGINVRENILCNANKPGLSTAENEKVVIEYENRIEQDGQKLIAHEKEIEKAEVPTLLTESRSNTNTPEKTERKLKMPESDMEIAESKVTRNKWAASQPDNSNSADFISHIFEKDRIHGLTSDVPEFFRSPPPGIFTSSGSAPVTPPSRRVERLAKLTCSESFSGPEAVLLTLATLAAENESGSDQEQEETDKKIQEKDQLRKKKYENDFSTETFKKVTKEIDQTDNSYIELKDDETLSQDTERNTKLNDVNKSQTAQENDGLEKKLEHDNGTLKQNPSVNDYQKPEILDKIKKCIDFTYDKDNNVLKVKRFTEKAVSEFPDLFGPNSEEIRKEVAVNLSLYMTNNYRKFVKEKYSDRKSKQNLYSEPTRDKLVSENSSKVNYNDFKSSSNFDQPVDWSDNSNANKLSVQNTYSDPGEKPGQSILVSNDLNNTNATNLSETSNSGNEKVKQSQGKLDTANILESKTCTSAATLITKPERKHKIQLDDSTVSSQSYDVDAGDSELEKANASKELENADASEELENADASKELETADASKELKKADASEELENADASEELEKAYASEELQNANTSGELENADTSEELENADISDAVSFHTDEPCVARMKAKGNNRVKLRQKPQKVVKTRKGFEKLRDTNMCIVGQTDQVIDEKMTNCESNTSIGSICKDITGRKTGITSFSEGKNVCGKEIDKTDTIIGKTNNENLSGSMFISELPIGKIMIRRDKSGNHVLQAADKSKQVGEQKQIGAEQVCKTNHKKKKLGSETDVSSRQVKPLKIKLNIPKKSKQQKIKLNIGEKLKQYKENLSAGENEDFIWSKVIENPGKDLSNEDSNKDASSSDDAEQNTCIVNGKLQARPVVCLNKIQVSNENTVYLSEEEMTYLSPKREEKGDNFLSENVKVTEKRNPQDETELVYSDKTLTQSVKQSINKTRRKCSQSPVKSLSVPGEKKNETKERTKRKLKLSKSPDLMTKKRKTTNMESEASNRASTKSPSRSPTKIHYSEIISSDNKVAEMQRPLQRSPKKNLDSNRDLSKSPRRGSSNKTQ